MLNWIAVEKRNYDYTLYITKKVSELSSLEAAHHTINFIKDSYPPPYYLFVSGGVDSQALLWAWHTSGAAYIPISIRYNVDLNDHDLDTLKQFSKMHNIDINYRDFDAMGFIKNEFVNYSEKYRCGSPQICTHMKMSEIVSDGTAIFSGQYLNYRDSAFVNKNNWGLYKYAEIEKRNIVPFFFSETMELAWSFKIKVKDKKFKVYRTNDFPVIPQNRKYTGFEKIKEYYDNLEIDISPKDKLSRIRGQGSIRNFDILFRNQYEHKYRKDLLRTIIL